MSIVILNNENQYQYSHPVSPLYISKNINFSLSKLCIAAKINGEIIDINDLITNNVTLEFITIHDEIGLNIIRRSCAHLLGRAIKQLWPITKMVVNSTTNTGFYYDIDLNYQLTTNDLKKLEQHMLYLSNQNYDIISKNVSWQQALDIFLSRQEIYKISIIEKKIKHSTYPKLYYHKEYIDLCKGPHVPNIEFCRYFKLCKISQHSSWFNKNKHKKLQRIYGIAWANEKQLTTHTFKLKNSKIRDHRALAKQLNLYHIQKEAPGVIFWHEKGWILFQELKKFIRTQLKIYKYKEVKSPIMMNYTLWKKTGHWDNYYKYIFSTTSENRTYCIKPMNCPGHIQIFNQGIKSYKDLPIRMAEFGNCHRNEPSGSLHGLMRIREFTQDDAHIFCTNTQIYNELDHCIQMMFDTYKIFGFKKILVKLSTRPEKRIGQDKEWDTAEQYLHNALQHNKIKFENNPHDGAFYGPKIEFILLDSFNRAWQCGTIQLDFSLPMLLNASYVDKHNNRVTPVIIHRAILGSMERFIGLLTEEYSGFFPTWLAPIQVVLMNVSIQQSEYVSHIAKKLSQNNIRIIVDLKNEKINLKIRLYTIQRVPYMLIIGDQEIQQQTIAVRTFRGKKLKNYKFDVFLEKLKNEINNYNLHQLEE